MHIEYDENSVKIYFNLKSDIIGKESRGVRIIFAPFNEISKSGDSGGSGDTLGTKWENELAIVDLTYLSLLQILVEPLYDFTNRRTNIFFIIIKVNMITSI
jgi:hypothetical protein